MSTGRLESWYRDNLGEPVESDHVYGYWAFLLAAGLGVAALGFLLLSTRYSPRDDVLWLQRQIAFTLALLAGPVVGLSVVYLLPLQRRATSLALAGLGICVLATLAFNWAYPFDWNAGVDRSTGIMAVYGAGVALQVLTAFAYPLLTEETASASVAGSAPTAAGESSSHAAGAASGAGAATDAGATDAAGAGATSRATFEFYVDRAGEHRWRLRHDNGNVIADSGEGYSSRSKARQGAESVRTNAPAADETQLESPPEGDGAAADADDGDVEEPED